MVLTSLFAALITVCAWIAVPVPPVGFTLQTLGVLLALGILGGRRGFWAVGLYLLLGMVGLPVFSGFRGGASALLGPTGGFLWGFAAMALCYRLLESFGKLPAMVAGQLVCYLCGCFWYTVYAPGTSLWAAAAVCVVPYLPGDAVKIGLACTISRRIAGRITL